MKQGTLQREGKASVRKLGPLAAALFCSAFSLSACAIASADNGISADTSLVNCQQGAEISSVLQLKSAEVGSTLHLTPPASDSLTLVDAKALTGPCLDRAEDFGPTGVLLMGENLSMTLDGTVAVSDGSNGESYYRGLAKLESDDDHPRLPGKTFSKASLVSKTYSSPGVVSGENYVGIWHGPDTSTLAAFTVHRDGSLSEARPLLTSSLPIRSVTYFPNPDTAAGSLGLIQEHGDELRLVRLMWRHKSLGR